MYSFEDYVLDAEQRELRRGPRLIPVQPQVFDLLEYLIRNRDRVVAKDDLITAIWGGRIVSESALTTRINAARTAIGDSGEDQRLIRTLPRKGLRFVGMVREEAHKAVENLAEASAAEGKDTSVTSVSEQPAIAERRQVTIISCELLLGAGAARMDPEDLRDVFGTYHRCVAETAGRFTGSIGHAVGRTILIYFGYPAAHEDDAEQAVRAALELCAALKRHELHRGLRLQARIGISTGQVIVDDASGEHTPVGEASSTASQLQNAAQPDTVLIDLPTLQLIGSLFDCREIEAISISGAVERLSAWQVLGTGSIESRFEALRPSARTPLVGREEELELLLRRWAQAKSGEGRVVLISGEPGIGKSRLVAELQNRLQAEPHEHLRYFCSPNLRDSALRPIVMQIERAGGFEDSDDPLMKLDKLVRILAHTSSINEDVGFIAELLSIPASDRYQVSTLLPQLKREKTFEVLLRQLESLAQKQPVLILFEDAHWIDPTSHELLDRIVELTAHLPVLLLITFRPEYHPSWIGQPHVTIVTLNRLSQREGAVLVTNIVGDNSLSRLLAEEIVERTDGVPLFVEELTKAVLEAGGDDRGEEIVSRIAPRALGVPATLQASLMARLDRLGRSAKEIAQVGAAIGREFSYDLLAAVAQRNEDVVRAALDQLTESGLISRRGTPPEASFTFKHALVQEAAYETLLRRARQQLHARIGDVLETAFSKIADTQPELVAHHFSEAALPERAQAYWLRASQIAAARSANIEAVSHATRGLEELRLLPAGIKRDRLELALRGARGPVLIATRGYAADETLEDYERARELIRATADKTFWDIVLTGLLVAYYNRGAYRRALDVGLEFMRQAESTRDSVALCVGHRLLAGPYNALGEFAASEAHGEAAFGFYNPDQHQPLAWRYVHDIGVAAASQWAIGAWHRGHIGVANRARKEALSIARQLEHHNTTGYALYYNGVFASFRQRDFPALAEYSAELLDHASRHNLPQWTAWTSALEGVARAHAGKFEEGIAAIERGLALCEKIKNQSMRTVFLAGLAETQLMAGRDQDAQRTIDAAVAIAERTEERWMDAELWRLRAKLVLASGGQSDAAEAERCLKSGIEVAENQGSNSYKLRLTTELAKLLADRRELTLARQVLASALKPFSDGFDTPDLINANELSLVLEKSHAGVND